MGATSNSQSPSSDGESDTMYKGSESGGLLIFVGMLIVASLLSVAIQVCRDSRRRRRLTMSVRSMSTRVLRRGLDAKSIEALPVFMYTKSNTELGNECAVCISEFEENEKVKSLPGCKHSFHVECIDMWLSSHASCPVCRETVTPSMVIDAQNRDNSQEEQHPQQEEVAIDIDGSASSRESFSATRLSLSSSLRRVLSFTSRPNQSKEIPSQSAYPQEQGKMQADTIPWEENA